MTTITAQPTKKLTDPVRDDSTQRFRHHRMERLQPRLETRQPHRHRQQHPKQTMHLGPNGPDRQPDHRSTNPQR